MGTDLTGDGENYKCSLSLCGALTGPGAYQCLQQDKAASACEVDYWNEEHADVMGVWATPTWSYIDAMNKTAGVQFNMTGTQKCYTNANPQGDFFTANVQLRCAPSFQPLQVNASNYAACDKTFIVGTPLACGSACSTPTLNGAQYDFSALAQHDWLAHDASSGQHKFALSVCGALASANPYAAQCGAHTSVCSLDHNVQMGTWDGAQSAPAWRIIDATNHTVGVQYTTAPGNATCTLDPTMRVTTTLQLLCSTQQDDHFTVRWDWDKPCQYTAQMNTVRTMHMATSSA